jgi:preprotein translocase subunit SecD
VASPGTLRVGRYLLALLVLLGVLYTLVFLPGNRHTPKLGIDLVGGVRVIFTARGHVTPTQMEQARQIMEDRVNGTGVTQSTVVVQGGDQIVISIPNGTQTDVAALGQPAKLNFRGVVAPAVPVTCGRYAPASVRNQKGTGTQPTTKPSGGSSAPSHSPSPSASTTAVGEAPNAAGHHLLAAKPSRSAGARTSAGAGASGAATGSATPLGTGSAGASGSASASASPSASPSAQLGGPCTVTSVKDLTAAKLPDPSGVYASNGLDATAAQALAAQLTNFDCSKAQTEPDRDNQYYVVCGTGITGPRQEYAYLLGPVIVPGTQIGSASAQAPNAAAGQGDWTILLKLKGKGDSAWAHYTADHNIGGSSNTSSGVTACGPSSTPCVDFVAFTLNGAVISSPVNEEAIPAGQATQISGSFTASSSKALAQQLQYGALPLSFRLDDNQHVSATLGSAQLKAAFLAGGIGLVLVVLYSLLYYRGLGLVTIASLLVSAGLTYAMLVILGIHLGFTLDLSGIAGFIVALGITADSFVVFFERIKDEVHEGRSFRVAVPRAWVRARRTILSADTVSFLAAAILYYFASAEVKGFAFTLGLSTILDLVVVFLFTHPMISLLARSRAFGSPRFTGLNSLRAGVTPLADEPATRQPRTRRSGATAAPAGGGSFAPPDAGVASGDEPVTSEPDERPVDLGKGGGEQNPDDPTTRRRTTPASGTAAERAAARRARLRNTGGATEGGTS